MNLVETDQQYCRSDAFV